MVLYMPCKILKKTYNSNLKSRVRFSLNTPILLFIADKKHNRHKRFAGCLSPSYTKPTIYLYCITCDTALSRSYFPTYWSCLPLRSSFVPPAAPAHTAIKTVIFFNHHHSSLRHWNLSRPAGEKRQRPKSSPDPIYLYYTARSASPALAAVRSCPLSVQSRPPRA